MIFLQKRTNSQETFSPFRPKIYSGKLAKSKEPLLFSRADYSGSTAQLTTNALGVA